MRLLSSYCLVSEHGPQRVHSDSPVSNDGHDATAVRLWRDDRCVETFHLTPEAASELMAFVMRALASSITEPSQPPLRVVAKDEPASVTPYVDVTMSPGFATGSPTI